MLEIYYYPKEFTIVDEKQYKFCYRIVVLVIWKRKGLSQLVDHTQILNVQSYRFDIMSHYPL